MYCSTKCAICFEEMKTQHFIPCMHSFHKKCIKSWVERCNSCPYCRKQVEYNNTLEMFTANPGYLVYSIANNKIPENLALLLCTGGILPEKKVLELIEKCVFSPKSVVNLITNGIVSRNDVLDYLGNGI